MKNILRKFLTSLDWSRLPIGPQAELMEQLKGLNRIVPSPLKPQALLSPHGSDREYWNNKGYREVSFDITKRFTWGRNTSHKIKDCIDYFQNLYPYKGYNTKINSIFDKREKSRSYNYLQFKRAVTQIDQVMANKRWGGEIWLDDDKAILTMIADIQNKIVSSFEVFSDYMKADSAYPDKKMKYFISDSSKVEDNHQLLTDVVQMLWKDDTYPAVVFLDDGTGKTSRGGSVQPIITLICQFPNLVMNGFKADTGKVPIFKSPIGKVVTAFQMDFEQIVRFALGFKRYTPYARHFIQKFWHKPPEIGIKHPYINGFIRRSNMIATPIDEWPVTFGSNSNTCFGNINVHQHAQNLNFILWAEEVHTWLTTFRIGTTHPLNSLNQTYWGHPEDTDPDLGDYYLDTIGHDFMRCHDRMTDYYNAIQRKDVCNTHCSEVHRQQCHGYTNDQANYEHAIVDLIFNEVTSLDFDHYEENIALFIPDSTHPLIDMYDTSSWDDYNDRYHYDVPTPPSDTIPYALPDSEHSLENDMKAWMLQRQEMSR